MVPSVAQALLPVWFVSQLKKIQEHRQKCLCHLQRPVLLQAGADFYVFGEAGEDGAAFGADAGGDDHAIGFDAA